MSLFLGIDRALWFVFALVWVISARFTKKTVRRDSVLSRLALLFPAVVVLPFVPPYSARWLPPDVVRWLSTPWFPATVATGVASVVITALGIALAFWARYELGRNWSGMVTLKEDHRLVTTGPYAFVRHPIYTGLLMSIVGTLLLWSTPAMPVVIVVLVLALRYKMSREELFMSDAFGEQYAAYKLRARALVPLVW